MTPAPIKPSIPFEYLEKIDIRVGTILVVEDVANSDKLVRLKVDFGDHTRSILVGIAFGDVESAAIGQSGLDSAFDEQLLAGIDLARQGDAATDAQPAHLAVGFGLVAQLGWTAQQRIGRSQRTGCPRQFGRWRRHRWWPDRSGCRRPRRPGRRHGNARIVMGICHFTILCLASLAAEHGLNTD